MSRLLASLWLVNRGARSVTFLAHFWMAFGCCLLFSLFLFGKAGMDYVSQNLLGSLPEQELRVGLRKKEVSFFQIDEPGGKKSISNNDLAAMARLTGVREVVPLRYGDQPSAVDIQFMGQTFKSDMVVQALDPAWLAEDIDPAKLVWREGETVPVVLNSQLLVIFNNGYAESQGLPRLSAGALMTPIWDFIYGGGSEGPPPITLKARIVGFSPRVALGAVIPNDVLAYLHRGLGLALPKVTEAVLRLSPDADAAKIKPIIEDMGFLIQEPSALARAFNQFREVTVIAGLMLVGCLTLFGMAYLNQTLKMLFYIKKRDYAICRAMGMSRAALRLILVVELTALIGLDLVLGLVAGYGLSKWLNAWYVSTYFESMIGAPVLLSIPWRDVSMLGLSVLVLGVIFLTPRIYRTTKKPVGQAMIQP